MISHFILNKQAIATMNCGNKDQNNNSSRKWVVNNHPRCCSSRACTIVTDIRGPKTCDTGTSWRVGKSLRSRRTSSNIRCPFRYILARLPLRTSWLSRMISAWGPMCMAENIPHPANALTRTDYVWRYRTRIVKFAATWWRQLRHGH